MPHETLQIQGKGLKKDIRKVRKKARKGIKKARKKVQKKVKKGAKVTAKVGKIAGKAIIKKAKHTKPSSALGALAGVATVAGVLQPELLPVLGPVSGLASGASAILKSQGKGLNKFGKKMKTVGSRHNVFHNLARRTSGGLTKKDLMISKRGKIISKKKHMFGIGLMKKRHALIRKGKLKTLDNPLS